MHSTSPTRIGTSATAFVIALLLPSTSSAQEVRNPAVPDSIYLTAIDFTSDAAAVVTGGNSVRVHDVATGALIRRISLPHPIFASCVACSPASQGLFATGQSDGVVRMYRIGMDRPIREWKSHGQNVCDLSFSPDGTQLVTSGAMGTLGQPPSGGEVRLWDVENGALLRSLEFREAAVSSVAFSRDGQHIALTRRPTSGDPKSTAVAELYDLRGWRLVRSVPFEPGTAIALCFSPDGGKLLIAGGICVPLQPGSCKTTGKLWVANLSIEGPARPIEFEDCDYFWSACFMPNGEYFATDTAEIRPNGPGSVPVILLRRLDTGKVIWSRDGWEGGPHGTAISPDGELVAACSGRQVHIHKATSGEPVRTINLAE